MSFGEAVWKLGVFAQTPHSFQVLVFSRVTCEDKKEGFFAQPQKILCTKRGQNQVSKWTYAGQVSDVEKSRVSKVVLL